MFRSKFYKGLRIIIVGLLSTAGLLFFTPTANADRVSVQGDGGVWAWDIYQYGITELTIFSGSSQNYDEVINVDGYDQFGRGMVNNGSFNGAYSDAVFVNGELVGSHITIPGTEGQDTYGSTMEITFSGNNVTALITSLDPTDLLVIDGDLGSDYLTEYDTLGSHFISYQKSPTNGLPVQDPIFMWETNGTINATDGDETPIVFITGTSLELKHYAYAYQINRAYNYQNQANNQRNADLFFAQFLAFVDEDPTRTDIFTYNFRDSAPVSAPVYVRKTTNLSFAQSLNASDTLSDPDGQLRATVDQIMSKYGSLIK